MDMIYSKNNDKIGLMLSQNEGEMYQNKQLTYRHSQYMQSKYYLQIIMFHILNAKFLKFGPLFSTIHIVRRYINFVALLFCIKNSLLMFCF